jgi:hypothetical protein
MSGAQRAVSLGFAFASGFSFSLGYHEAAFLLSSVAWAIAWVGTEGR